ncbi:MAG: helix-turn-helix transcriptional regulator [Clostridiaceae bacterium]|nr:helix-turn-helix transcriptional regulator [Clostridiaceae bacterium]
MDTDRARDLLSKGNQEQYKGQWVETIRLQLGLSQEEFAEMLGTTQSLLSRVERGERKLSGEAATAISGFLADAVIARRNTDHAEISFVPPTKSTSEMEVIVRAEVAEPIDAYELTFTSEDASAATGNFAVADPAYEAKSSRDSLDPKIRAELIAAIATFCARLSDADLKSLYELICCQSEVAEAETETAPPAIPEEDY